MMKIEIQKSIVEAVSQLSLSQQMKLLAFIQSLHKKENNIDGLTRFAGAFTKEELEELGKALNDCEQIDENEW